MRERPVTVPTEPLPAIRASRRHPRRTQFDYLHLRAVIERLRSTIASLPEPVTDVLDVWCGSRPYDDLLPSGARSVGLDIVGNPYGVADVVSDEFLPFPDASFDLALMIEAFQYVRDPVGAVIELRRVLRPGGTVLVALPFAFEYDRRDFQARYTAPQLRALFADGWEDVRVGEDGGRAVTWTVLTGSLVHGVEQRATRRLPRRAVHPVFAGAYAALNSLGGVLARLEGDGGPAALPTHLTLTARKPAGG